MPDNVAPLSDEPQDEDSAFLDNPADGYASQFGELDLEPGAAAVVTKRKAFNAEHYYRNCDFVRGGSGGGRIPCVFHNTPAGTWAPADGSGTSYYVFDNNGTVELVAGTVRYKGTYALSDTDGSKRINLYIPVGYSAIQGDFDYTLSGNILRAKRLKFPPARESRSSLFPPRFPKTH